MGSESSDEETGIEISLFPSEKERKRVIQRSPSSTSSEGTPVRHIFCVKKNMDLKTFDETEDCFILDFDPFENVDFSKLSVSKNLDADNDISVVAEKGQVACRDYPHSRHLCLKYPFKTMPHESYCELCYCYVCDTSAPCDFWMDANKGHCHASEHDEEWKLRRKLKKMGNVFSKKPDEIEEQNRLQQFASGEILTPWPI